MKDRASRRRYLQVFGAAVVAGAAGCTDSGDSGPANSDGSETDDGSTNDDSTDDSTNDDDSTDDGSQSSDDDTGDDDTGDADDDSDENDGQTDGDDDTAPRLAEVFTWTESYVMEIEASDFEGTWRFNDGDWQLTTTTDGQTSEIYSISTDDGTDTYVVSDGQCFKTESVRRDPFDPQEPADDGQEYVASGRTTIDGQEVYQFDVEGGVYYVSVETGYPVRFEGADGTTVQFTSWGETERITPPDMECVER